MGGWGEQCRGHRYRYDSSAFPTGRDGVRTSGYARRAGTPLIFRRLQETRGSAAQLLATINGRFWRFGLVLRGGSATVIDEPSPTKRRDQVQDSGGHRSWKSRQHYFGMKTHMPEECWSIDSDA